MKIEVRNEVCPPSPPGCLSQRLKIGTRPSCGDTYCCPIFPPGVGVPRKLLFSRSRGVNAFVCVDNGLPAALPHASPRLKIPMAPKGTRFQDSDGTPGYPGGRYPEKTLVLEKLGVKVQGGIGEVQNEDWGSKRSLDPPRAAYPRGLRLGRDPVVVIGIVAPLTPGGRYSEKTLILEIPGGKCVRMRG